MQDGLRQSVLSKARAFIAAKAKPEGSLGRLEALAVRLCEVQGTLHPTPRPAQLTLFVADHGAARSGVTAWPQAVTRAATLATLAGGSGCAVLAKATGVEMRVVDVGLAGEPLPAHARLLSRRIREGTRDLTLEPALLVEEFHDAVAVGREAARLALAGGAKLLIAGEIGIGNTTASAALTAFLCGGEPGRMVGNGAGVTDAILARKRQAVAAAVARARGLEGDAAIASLSGLEIAAMAGFYAEGAAHGATLLLDGSVTVAAALIASRLHREAPLRMVGSHLSPEPCHAVALAALGLEPYLDWGMRLGEGTGALLLLPMLDAAAAILKDMATLDSLAL
jgi:nicotinate-nucleotide--dimethylbenzimidazole phosphoribosyltransferase